MEEGGNKMGFGFKIKQASMTEYYIAENGDHVSVTIRPDETACLIICKPVNNALYFQHTFKTRRSAIIAMHRKCGKCEFSSMQRVYVKDVE